jgi:excisionase family DNA binding protein
MKRLLTINEVCNILQVSKPTVYRWVHEEFIPHVKLRGALRFDEEVVYRWVDAKRRTGRNRRIPETHIISRD